MPPLQSYGQALKQKDCFSGVLGDDCGASVNLLLLLLLILTYSDDFGHLARFDRSVSVDVVHLERPLQLLFRLSGRRDVDRQQKLLEVDPAAVVGVERPKYVLAELLRVALWEETGIDLEELGPRQLPRRTVLLQDPHRQSINQSV